MPPAPRRSAPASRSERPVWCKKTSSRVGSERLMDLSADLLAVQQTEQVGKRRAPVLDVEAQVVALGGDLTYVGSAAMTALLLSSSPLPLVVQAQEHRVPRDLALQVPGGPFGDDLAVVHDHEAVAQGVSLLEVVGREEDRRAACDAASGRDPRDSPGSAGRAPCSARPGRAPRARARSRGRRRVADAGRPSRSSRGDRRTRSGRGSPSASAPARPPRRGRRRRGGPGGSRFSRPVASSSAPPSWLT